MEINLMDCVSQYVLRLQDARRYLSATFDLVDFLVKKNLYNMENRKYVTIGFGRDIRTDIFSNNNGINFLDVPRYSRVPMSGGMNCYIASNLFYIKIVVVDIKEREYFELFARNVPLGDVKEMIRTEDY